MTEPTVYAGAERRGRNRENRPGWPPWAIRLAAVVLFFCVMVPLGFILYYAHRADDRAERAGRTVCEQAQALDSLASSFDRTISLLSGEVQQTAERELRSTIEGADAAASSAAKACQPGDTR